MIIFYLGVKHPYREHVGFGQAPVHPQVGPEGQWYYFGGDVFLH